MAAPSIVRSAADRKRTLAEPQHVTVEQRRRRNFLTLALLALAVIVVAVAVIRWRSLPNEEVALVERPVAPIMLTGAEIMAAYEDDPALTALGGPILVSAPLATTPSSGTTVLLRTADPLRDISADIVPTDAVRLADVEIGTEVVLMCEEIGPGMMAPSLEDCRLAPVRP